jgi:hypothetical protein
VGDELAHHLSREVQVGCPPAPSAFAYIERGGGCHKNGPSMPLSEAPALALLLAPHPPRPPHPSPCRRGAPTSSTTPPTGCPPAAASPGCCSTHSAAPGAGPAGRSCSSSRARRAPPRAPARPCQSCGWARGGRPGAGALQQLLLCSLGRHPGRAGSGGMCRGCLWATSDLAVHCAVGASALCIVTFLARCRSAARPGEGLGRS